MRDDDLNVRDFPQCERGNVGIMFALVLLPILFCIGAAIDYARLTEQETHLQNAADSASLAAALAFIDAGEEDMTSVGKDIFQMNAGERGNIDVDNIKVEKTDHNTVKLTTRGSVDAKFVQLFGYPKLEFNVSSESSLHTPRGLELAIAFDSTNSMNFDSRWDNAMTAIDSTMTSMKSLTGNKEFYATLVPFSDRVNIGQMRSSWLASAQPTNWTGCVEPREFVDGSFNWAVDDQPLSSQRFEASISGVTGNLDTISCPSVDITGPTKNPDEIITAAKSMSHGGTGRFDTGMAWAWRVLSPEWRGQWQETDYPALTTEKRAKKIIFVSDGNSNAYRKEMSAEDSWGWNQGSIVAFEHLTELCRKIKADGIEIYMLKVEGNPHADSYFQQCASSINHYYTVDGAEDITVAFNDILDGLYAELRIVN